MNSLNNAVDEVVECPLCMEPLEVDDLNFFPCTCGYQICRFCWHRIRTDENELCPACRKEYPENPADFKPLTQEEMIAFKSQKRQRDQQRKQKITENRKHLANVRVVQKNLVFVVGLPPRLADADILKKHEYFGKYGKIHKVVINPSTAYAGVQGPSASAYVTYVHNADALRAIQSVNNIMIDGRLIKTSLGTTKYCSHFMKNQQCPKGDCMYLHELGDLEASFTKEEMHQGKHQEYEKRLHDVLIASSSGCGVSIGSTMTNSIKISESNKLTGISTTQAAPSLCVATSNLASNIGSTPQKEAWPSLSLSPVNQKDFSSNNVNKNKKERIKQDKNKSDKSNKIKNNRNNNNTTIMSLTKEVDLPVIIESPATSNNWLNEESSKTKNEKGTERIRPDPKKEHEIRGFIKHSKASTSTSLNLDNSNDDEYLSNKIRSDSNITKEDCLRSLSTSSNGSSCIVTISENNSFVNESISGKSSPGSYNGNNASDKHTTYPMKCNLILTPNSEIDARAEIKSDKNDLSENSSTSYGYNFFEMNENTEPNIAKDNTTHNNLCENIDYNDLIQKESEGNDSLTDTISKLSIFEESSYFSSTKGILHPSLPLHLRHIEEVIPNQPNTANAPNLPDLINGIDAHQNIANDYQTASNSYLTGADLRRQASHYQYQQQVDESSNDNVQDTLFGTNMSKFFDFHKNQQQQKLQHCLQINGPSCITGAVNDNLHMMPLIDNTRLNSQLVDQGCILSSQHHQKPKFFGKVDKALCHQTHQQVANPQISTAQTQQNQYIHSSTCDDELGFDPFIETQKALAELIENEVEQNMGSTCSKISSQNQLNNVHQPHQQHLLEYMQRTRMPPPGFNQVNNISGYGVVPRIQNSKVISFMNLPNNYMTPTGQHVQHTQQLQVPSNAWTTHFGNFQQHICEQQIRQVNSNQLASGSGNQKGYTGNDWTAMDPAILSFRQFSFPHQTQVTPQIQNQQQEMFLQQLAQQQQQTAFTSQSQHLSGTNAGIATSIINSQQSSQAHVNANVQGMLEYLKTRQFV